jgi:hypothetical protein
VSSLRVSPTYLLVPPRHPFQIHQQCFDVLLTLHLVLQGGGWQGGREKGREGEREGGRKGGREGGRRMTTTHSLGAAYKRRKRQQVERN